ncbi:MAG: RNA polymerase sigma factor [Myxococcota bacterium]
MQEPNEKQPKRPALTDWSGKIERALAGDRIAYGQLARLVTGYLSKWRAFDFQAEWDDIVQEVLLSAIAAQREGRIPNDAAFHAFVRQATRFRFVDQIRAAGRKGPTKPLQEESEGEDVAAAVVASEADSAKQADLRLSVRQALDRLDERERQVVLEVYLRGLTYPEASKKLGIPLGTLKDVLKSGVARLRRVLEASADDPP